MRKIDLKGIIEFHKLTDEEVASKLFPDNKYAKMALRRVLNGETVLDETQIVNLSILTGEDISDLFTEDNWKMRSHGEIFNLTKPGFQVSYNSKTNILAVHDLTLDSLDTYPINPGQSIKQLIDFINTKIY